MGGQYDSFQTRVNSHQRHDNGKYTLLQTRTDFYFIDEQSGLLKVQLVEVGLAVD